MNAQGVLKIAVESAALKQRFFAENAGLLVEVGGRIAERLRAGGAVLVFGNGGSAAAAQHFAGELVGCFLRDRAALPALALNADGAVLTGIGNDLGFESVFKRQVEALGRPGDVAVGISTSGRSANVVEGLLVAHEKGLVTVALTGGGGGLLAGLVDYLIEVPHDETPRVQEVHAMVVHLLCQIVEQAVAR